jgi:hypothetical protein
MSQHDMTVDNAGAATVRVDINAGLQALASTSSGATAPTTTFANQLWYDTANKILKIRNADNDAWISLVKLDQTNDQVDISYLRNKLEFLSDALADIGDSTNAAKDIYMQGDLYFDNDNSRTQKHYLWEPISSGTASLSTSLDFSLPSEYDVFLVMFENVFANTDAANFCARVSDDGGSTWESDYSRGGMYAYHGNHTGWSSTYYSLAGLAPSCNQDYPINGNLYLYNANSSNPRSSMLSHISYIFDNQYYSICACTAANLAKSGGAADMIRFLFSTGTITSGSIYLFGRKYI